jgi:hypothetical protein
MTFQAIINTSQRIEVDRRRMVGQSISRSQRVKTAQRVTAQPFVLTVTPLARFKWTDTRQAVELIQNYDRNTECVIQIGSIPNLYYLNQYQGSMSAATRAATTITNFTSTTVTFKYGNTLEPGPVTAFRAGDWIQPTNSRYPYILTSDVTYTGSISGIMTGTVHRPLITSEGISVTGTMKVGTETTMVVVATEFPTYQYILKDWAQYTGDFTFVEKVI